MDDFPRPADLPVASGDAHPAALGFAFVVGATAVGHPVGEGDVVGAFDGDFLEFEDVRAGAHFHARDPVRAVRRFALELQGLDRIEGDDVVGVQRHDFLHVLGHDGFAIGVDQGLDFRLCAHAVLRGFCCEDTFSRSANRQIDSRNKKFPLRPKSLESEAHLCRKKEIPVSAQLVPYDSLNALQRQQVEAIEINAEQIKFSGDIHGALHTLLSKPGPGVKGFALLADEVPVAFLLLKRPPVLPAWANEHSATLHALQVDHRAQGKGFGKACLQALPEVARQAWPEIKGLELSVDADNDAAIALYAKHGYVDSGEAYKGRIGYERRMGLVF